MPKDKCQYHCRKQGVGPSFKLEAFENSNLLLQHENCKEIVSLFAIDGLNNKVEPHNFAHNLR